MDDAHHTPSQHIHAFVLDEETLLFDSRTRRIFRLNTTASAIWQGIVSGLSTPEIASVLSQQTKSRPEYIAAEISRLVAEWQQCGFFKARESNVFDWQPPDDQMETKILLKEGETVQDNHASCPTLTFKIIDTTFALKVPTQDTLTLVEPLLKHLLIPRLNSYLVQLAVVKTNLRYLLLQNGAPVDWCASSEGIAPMVHANALISAYDRATDYVIGVHAAAMAVKGLNIVLPALSGSGKSTLTAALAGAGHQYLADDLVLLTERPVCMRPVPVAIGLKAGSWPVLESRLPQVSDLTTHQRADNKLVRYFVPPSDDLSDLDFQPMPVHAFIFPRYEKNEDPVLQGIGRCEALYRIAEAGYDTRNGLTIDIVEQLVDWISLTPCFELHYDNLDQAVKILGSSIG
jgi:hypothetical protein